MNIEKERLKRGISITEFTKALKLKPSVYYSIIENPKMITQEIKEYLESQPILCDESGFVGSTAIDFILTKKTIEEVLDIALMSLKHINKLRSKNKFNAMYHKRLFNLYKELYLQSRQKDYISVTNKTTNNEDDMVSNHVKGVFTQALNNAVKEFKENQLIKIIFETFYSRLASQLEYPSSKIEGRILLTEAHLNIVESYSPNMITFMESNKTANDLYAHLLKTYKGELLVEKQGETLLVYWVYPK